MGTDSSGDLGRRWKVYHGIAAMNIQPDSRRIEVIVGELLPLYDGASKATEFTHAPSVKNVFDSAAVSSQVVTKNTITADYMGSNNLSVPDIVMGEEVWIYNFTGSDRYYWKPKDSTDTTTGKYLRNGEHVRISVASKKAVEKLTDDNSWFIEIDTRGDTRKFIFSTSEINGEVCRYKMVLDAKAGSFSFTDSVGNEIGLSSMTHQIVITNVMNTIRMDKGILWINAGTKLMLTSPGVEINANQLDFSLGGPTNIVSDGVINVKCTGLDITGEMKMHSILQSTQHIQVAGTVQASKFVEA